MTGLAQIQRLCAISRQFRNERAEAANRAADPAAIGRSLPQRRMLPAFLTKQ